MVAIIAIALLPAGAFVAFGLAWLALAAASALARLGPLRLVRASWIVLPFTLIALPLLVTRPGEPVLVLPGPLALTVTDAGLRDVATIVTKSWLSVQVALLLAFTTPFPVLIEALRALRLPAVMTSIIGFMYRYLAVLSDEAARMNLARASRSARAQGRGGGGLAWRASVTGAMVGSLFLRSYERSERVYAAMQARGFQGTVRGLEAARPTPGALLAFTLFVGGVAAFTLAAHLALPRW